MRKKAGRVGRTLPLGVAPAGAALFATTAQAAPFGMDALARSDHTNIGVMAISVGLLCVTVVTGSLFALARGRSSRNEAALRGEIADLRARLDRSEALLTAEPQVVVVFGADGEEPDITGDLSATTSLPSGRRVLALGSWVVPNRVWQVEEKIERLRQSGEAFDLEVRTRHGEFITVEGRAVGGRAVLRLRDVSGDKLALSQTREKLAQAEHEFSRIRALLQALPQPVWLRDEAGRLVWVNDAFASAVEAKSGEIAVAGGMELLDRSVRDEIARTRSEDGAPFRRNIPAIVAGQRHAFDVVDVACTGGSAGMATDISDLENMRSDLERRMEAHRKTLDELATAVAIFGANGRLVFHNQAYRALWNLPEAFLDSEPSDSDILDKLRAARELPEEADFRTWKAQLHEAYRMVEPRERWWYLPDGRTVRVVQAPNPEGGVTYLFDDVSERVALESSYNALNRVQRETLDNLRDGVAVFGSDGRLKLHNPAFQRMWKFAPEMLGENPHAEQIFAHARTLHDHDEPWDALRTVVTAIPEGRMPVACRVERSDGPVIDIATAPLPDGATLVSFSDVTASVAMERTLTEHNEALEAAAQIKSDFVKHVSYELRSPLTHIIGFSQLLGDDSSGGLSERQHEYLRHIEDSSAALYAIVNDILDLATIDAGAMELDLGTVDIRTTIRASAEGVRDRLAEARLTLDISVPPRIGSFVADEKRVRQVLFNLLSNAIRFSPQGGLVRISAERRADCVAFHVQDQGPGIPEEDAARAFERFESGTDVSGQRGVGLGLSIVRSFVELHGGKVVLETPEEGGTRVSCLFPLEGHAARVAAE